MSKEYHIPQDWDGQTWQCVQLLWPSSPMWLATLRDLVTDVSRGRTWDGSTGVIVDAQVVGRAIRDYNIPFSECAGNGDLTGVLVEETVYFYHQEDYNVQGGSLSAGETVRPVNTKVGDPSWAFLAGQNYIRLTPGSYHVEIVATCYRAGRAYLYLLDGNGNVLLTGNSEYASPVTTDEQTTGVLTLKGPLVVVGDDVLFRVYQHSQFAYATYGLGVAHLHSPRVNKYLTCKITRQVAIGDLTGPQGPPGPQGERGLMGPPGNAEGRIEIRETADLSHIEWKYAADPHWNIVITAPGDLVWQDRDISEQFLIYYWANKGPAYPTTIPGNFPGFGRPEIHQMLGGADRNRLAIVYERGGTWIGDSLCSAVPCEIEGVTPDPIDPVCVFASKMAKLLDDIVNRLDKKIWEADEKIEELMILGAELGLWIPASRPASLLALAGHILLWGADIILDQEFDADFWTEFKCKLYCAVAANGSELLSASQWEGFYQDFSSHHEYITEPGMVFFNLWIASLDYERLLNTIDGVDLEAFDCADCECAEWSHTYIFENCSLDTFMSEPDVQYCDTVDNAWRAKDQGDGSYVLNLTQYAAWTGADSTTRVTKIEATIYRPDPAFCTINDWGIEAIGGVNWTFDLKNYAIPNTWVGFEGMPPDLGPVGGFRFRAEVTNLQPGVAGMPGVQRVTVWGVGTDPHPGHA